MNLDNLKLFKKIVEEGSFSKASKALGIQPAVVTRRISNFEKELNQQVLNRSRKGVLLTDSGEILYRRACHFEALEEETMKELEDNTQDLQGEIKIYTTMGAINFWLVSKVVKFLTVHPNVKLNIQGSNEPLELLDYRADVIVGPYKKRYENLEKIYITSHHLKIYASSEYLKNNGTPKTEDDLDNHLLLSFSEGSPASFGDVDRFLLGKNGPRKPYMNINSANGLLEAAESNLGICCLSKEFIEGNNSDLVDVFPDNPGEKVDLFYIFHKNMRSFKRITSLGNFLHDEFG